MARLGDTTNTVKFAEELVKDSTNQAPALALAAHFCWQIGETKAATNAFHQLRAGSARFDLSTPIFARLAPIAQSLELPADWHVPVEERKDTGNRPSLDSLGPFRWQTYRAPAWVLTDADRNPRSLSDYHNGPVLVVFCLGHGCPHCIEQLSLLAPIAKEFEAQGMRIVAVSTDRVERLSQTAEKAKLERGFLFPLVSDVSLKTFKAYRAYDDFEQMPLHSTFLIDRNGKVRWQDIGYEPFKDLKFLLAESRRLLGLSPGPLAARSTGGE